MKGICSTAGDRRAKKSNRRQRDNSKIDSSRKKKRGTMYVCSWFTLPYSRKQHNVVKQLYYNKKLKTKQKLVAGRAITEG